MWTLTTFKKKTESVLFHEHFKHHKNSGTIQWILGTQEPMATSFENEYGWRRAVEMLGWLFLWKKFTHWQKSKLPPQSGSSLEAGELHP